MVPTSTTAYAGPIILLYTVGKVNTPPSIPGLGNCCLQPENRMCVKAGCDDCSRSRILRSRKYEEGRFRTFSMLTSLSCLSYVPGDMRAGNDILPSVRILVAVFIFSVSAPPVNPRVLPCSRKIISGRRRRPRPDARCSKYVLLGLFEHFAYLFIPVDGTPPRVFRGYSLLPERPPQRQKQAVSGRKRRSPTL